MRLKYQLFLTLLLSSIVLIALMAAFNSWSFNRGFSNYVVENEIRRQIPIAEALVETYIARQSWDWVKEQPELVHDLIRANLGRGRAPGSESKTPGKRRDRRLPRLLLVDADRQPLFGRGTRSKNVVWQPLSDENNIIGYLGVFKPRGLPGAVESVFVNQQLRSYAYAAVAMVFLSALFAIALATRIVKPILKINKAVGHITGGEYQHRIESNRQDEIGDLSRNINQMGFTLEKNQLARQQWMAEISHELRTPVAVLQGELEALQDGVTELNESAVSSLHAESVRLTRLINDLHELSLSDMGAMNYRMESTDLHKILEQRLHMGSSWISQAKLSISVQTGDDPVTVYGDPQRLSQLIDNLLQNSIRYTDEGGEIVISLSTESDLAILDWTDSAPGVTEAQLPNLFNTLYRAEQSRNRAFGGSGLGLAIVEKIVEAHQGKIHAYHAQIGGLGIRIQLPK